VSEAGEKPFSVALTVGPLTACHHSQHRSRIATSFPGTGQTCHWEKQQGEDQTHDHSGIGWTQPWNGCISQGHHCGDQRLKQSCLLGCRQKKQAANSFLEDGVRDIQFFLLGS
jgi:hypothetical protein